MIDRRALLARSSLLAVAGTLPACAPLARPGAVSAGNSLPAFYADIEERTFRWFWDHVNRRNGLVPDRAPTPSFCSIAAVGFALTAYPIGVERGWCSRAEARDLTLTTLRFFWNAPQGPEPSGKAGHKGFFYHFIDMETGARFRDVELSSVDTTLLLLGVLFAGRYYDRDHPAEAEIRRLAQALYARADWNFFRSDGRKAVSMGWHPERGLIARNWEGYNEGMAVYVLGLGAPEHPLPADSWKAWTATYPQCWRGAGATRRLAFGPLFPLHYSHIWIDFRGIRDAVMREAGFDYFENNRRETLANRAYCIANPMGWDGYGPESWGLAACDGPGNFAESFKGERREFFGYSARGPIDEPDGRDDGTITPSAALGSLPFAPEIVIPTAQAMRREHGDLLYGKYGFYDAFNPSFRWQGRNLEKGRVDPEKGWYDTDYIGIDQGPILTQAANYRNDFIWRRMREEPAIRRGLTLAGFTGGWLA
ncbi:Tat pathway signal protein [Sphingomonas psychrotolerans]|uniref:Tat pathway signal protein n=1 Tax=Sphingomonas psychrotolerans TaxID=1327635 RepID=A0ABU3N441_9SPHN|nr:glucoamylase family protein [Sphingomonas psychrotolerans]MDT8758552.1 Tat pathway signal protein [Sphingomonas psychrotolerans]